jgi:hypothetical protein
MANFDFPGTSPIADDKGTITGPWLNVFSRWQNINAAAQQSGTTAQRPTSLLWIGRRFYDTTLGYPVWVHSVAGGVATWHNAAGAVV